MIRESKNKRVFGSIGEKIAKEYLEENNYKIITTNFRVGRFGEIDIIAREYEYLCFIEVKTRTSTFFGMPSEAVNRKKQEKIMKLAYIYINQNKLSEQFIRFDIVEIIIGRNQSPNEINLIRNAF